MIFDLENMGLDVVFVQFGQNTMEIDLSIIYNLRVSKTKLTDYSFVINKSLKYFKNIQLPS